MKTVGRSIVLTGVFVMLLSSCVQYHGIQPVSPKPCKTLYAASEREITKVDSLQPTFSWKCEGSSQTKYDIIVYTGVATFRGKNIFGKNAGSPFYMQGVEVYYREGIEGRSHRIEQPLEPKTVYVWSVRPRSGTSVAPWSTYDSHAPLDANGYYNVWWPFRTPKR